LAARKSAKNDITLDQLLGLREQTERLSEFLRDQLAGYLATLRALLAPRRVLGKYAGGTGSIAREDEAFELLRKKYNEVCGSPFRLPSSLEREHLANVDADLDLYPWEYTHEASGDEGAHPITITSPVRWVLAYHSDYTLQQVRGVLAGKAERRPNALRDFVVHALVIDLVLSRNPGVSKILTDLRYDLDSEHSSEFGKLPLTTLTAPLTSFLPPDKLVLSSTRFSGVPAFIELIDTDSIDQLADPLQSKLREIIDS
jgi:hypothetical protein